MLGVYAEQNVQGQRLATLHSGASVETLAVSGEFTQVRLSDGTTGWVKSAYLTTQEPATVRVKQLEEELDRSRATTPALAEAAARSEVEQLKSALTDKQAELDACARTQTPGAAARRLIRARSMQALPAAAAPAQRRPAGIMAAISAAAAAAPLGRGLPWCWRRLGLRLLAGLCHPGAAHQAQVRRHQGLLTY